MLVINQQQALQALEIPECKQNGPHRFLNITLLCATVKLPLKNILDNIFIYILFISNIYVFNALAEHKNTIDVMKCI